jgi:hypothetical protein
MKNIRIYNASKYGTSEYEEVEKNIYKTYEKDDGNLSLIGVTDLDKMKALENMSGWKPGKTDADKLFECITYSGKKYYKREINGKTVIFENRNDNKSMIYVTSIMFEQEPEYEENSPNDAEISQYPLEDILDEFLCNCEDFYEEENKNDSVNSYIEFSSPNIENIKKLLTIVGKHVYNKENGDYIKLIIEN